MLIFVNPTESFSRTQFLRSIFRFLKTLVFYLEGFLRASFPFMTYCFIQEEICVLLLYRQTCPKVRELVYLRRPPSCKHRLHCASLKKEEFLQMTSRSHPLPCPTTITCFGKNVFASKMLPGIIPIFSSILSPLLFSA